MFSFPGSILQRTIPYNFFPFQEVSCRELFPTNVCLSRKYPAENYSLQFLFLSRKYPAENYSLHNFSFPGSILQRTIPYNFFPFQEVSCRELFPTIFFLSRKYPAENYSLHFFPFQEVSCRELFPTIFFLSRKYPAENYSPHNFSFSGSILQRNCPYMFFSYHFFSK